MKPDIELKHVKGNAYVLIIDLCDSNTSVYIKNKDHTISMMQPKKKKLKESSVLSEALDVSPKGEAAARRAVFVVHDGGKCA